MKTYYGSFRALEQAFVTYLGQLKPGPGRPVLVICPSGRVADYLRRRQVRQDGIVSNVFFMTLSQLMSQLDEEAPAGKLPLLPGDSFHDYLLKNLLVSPGLNRYPVSRGFVSAVRASLRDLADSLADPAILEEHLYTTTDPIFLAEEAHWKWLVDLYKNYQQRMGQIPGFRSYQQYFSDVLTQAEISPWLHDFTQLVFYGFYELTGRQLELFQLLRDHYPLTVFWAYEDRAAFTFGRKFFETNIVGGTGSADPLLDHAAPVAVGQALPCLFTAEHVSQTPAGLHITCAPDPEGELFFVAKEIIRLHEEEGIAFSDMAVTARSLEPYKNLLPEVFAQNAIALQAQFSTGLTAHPLGVFVLNLLTLARNGFAREDILAIVTSPYFKHSNQWRYVIEKSLAKRDFAQWVGLVRPQQEGYDPAFLTWLEKTKNELEQFEQPLSWVVLCQAVQQFLQDNTATENFSTQELQIWQQMQEALGSLKRYESVATQAREREFLEEVLSVFQNINLAQTVMQAGGVSAVEVSALRGLRFEAVFVLGMNEKIFPQVIREDPVLKDNYRRILRDQLGFWINQKMERFEEERLLFFCTVEAARTQLYLSFLRNDEEGKPLVPSSYLAELARAAQLDLTSDVVTHVRGRLSERLQDTPFTRLTAQEVSWLLAAQEAPEEAYQQAGLWGESQQASCAAARQLSSAGALTERDGLIQSGGDIFKQQNAQGFSPSALQDLAHCPMKYFLAKGIGLKESEETLSREALAPNLRGRLYHEVLMDYYEHLYQEGLAGQLFASAMQERVCASLAAHYTAASYKTFGIYPVIWKIILEDMQEKLTDFVLQDGQQLEGYVPSIFETYFEKMYQPSQELQLKLKGIIDRIDVNAAQQTFRVIDYKSSRHGGKDLAADMFKYVILQPFIYLILAQDTPPTQGLQADGAALLNINTGYKKQELTQAGFEAVKVRAADFFTLLANLIQKGQFFIAPGEHCPYCPYSNICRKDSFRAVLRTRHHSAALALEEAKQ